MLFSEASKSKPDSQNLPSQELLTIVTGLAHYTKLLIRIGLVACIKSCKPGQEHKDLETFLQLVEKKDEPTELSQAHEAKLDRRQASIQKDTDLCKECGKTVEDRCFSTQKFGGSPWHLGCVRCESQACYKLGAYDEMNVNVGPRRSVLDFEPCRFCGHSLQHTRFFVLSKFDQYCALLYLALMRLSVLLERRR